MTALLDELCVVIPRSCNSRSPPVAESEGSYNGPRRMAAQGGGRHNHGRAACNDLSKVTGLGASFHTVSTSTSRRSSTRGDSRLVPTP